MYLVRTPALRALRGQIAQTGHELATVLRGLDGLAAEREDGARDVAVRHARRFAFDAALARIVDALDGYLAALRGVDAFAEAVPALATHERSVKARLDALLEGVGVECTLEVALAHLAIQWRNRRSHTGSTNRLEQRYVAKIRAAEPQLVAHARGMTAKRLLDHFEASRSPRPRELAALARAVRESCAQADGALVLVADPEAYATWALRSAFTVEGAAGDAPARLEQVWAQGPDKRGGRLAQLLRERGFAESPAAAEQGELPDEWIDDLAHSGVREVGARLGLLEERREGRDPP